MFYVTTREYVGPNHTDSHGALIVREPVTTISTEEPRTNQSGQVRTEGWLGTTNDWSASAHGEFETLEAARTYCAEQGWTEAVPCEDEIEWSETDILEQWQSATAAAAHWEAADWFSSVSASDLGITAETTDEALKALAATEDASAFSGSLGDGPVVLHDTEEYLRSVRDDLRENA